MAKQTILTERGTGEVMYPHTLASLVQTADGGNVDEGLEKVKFALFNDEWNDFCKIILPQDFFGYGGSDEVSVGCSDSDSGCFELNGITGITYAEALRIRSYWIGKKAPNPGGLFYQVKERTFLPMNFDQFALQSAYGLFLGCSNLEALTIKIRPDDMRNMFANCTKLRKINGYIYPKVDSLAFIAGAFSCCYALEDVAIFYLNTDISFADSPLLSMKSVRYMIANAVNTTPITIAVHADVYAKLTGDTTNAAAAALSAEELAAWLQVLTDAVAKNITFATT